MHWHAEVADPASPNSLTLRGYDDADGFERKLRYRVVGQGLLRPDGCIYLFGFLSRSGEDVQRGDWRDLRNMLTAQYGVTRFDSHRRTRPVEFRMSG